MSWTAERARVASLSRSREPDDPALTNARRDLRAARAEDYLRQLLAAAPPLSVDQRNRLAVLLLTAPEAGGAPTRAVG